MYKPGDYLWMTTDERRVQAYAGAIRAVVRPGDRVLEIGAGFGFFSVIAARAGAVHVDAIDSNPVVHLGRRVALANACADRITFHHGDARMAVLPERADVLVSDLRGPTPFCGRAIETLIDARTRLLRPHGAIIAATDTLYVAASRAPEAFRDEVLSARGREGVDVDPVLRVVYDTPLRCTIAPGDLLSEPSAWCTIDYETVSGVDHRGEAILNVGPAEPLGGLAVWFDTVTARGFGFSTAPGSGTRAYGQMFLPFSGVVPPGSERRIRARLSAHLVGGDYLWAWEVAVQEDDGRFRTVSRQNSVAELVVDPAALAGSNRSLPPSVDRDPAMP